MASTAVATAATPRTKHAAAAAIDNRQDIDVPLDYSFYNLTSLDDIQDEEPRPHKGKEIVRKDDKFNSKILKLNNNQLTDLSNLFTACETIFHQPKCLTWVDLSSNELSKIDSVFCDLPNLKILYLHGNIINDIKEIDKLGGISTLTKLSLHANPIENVKGYKWYVLSRVTQLNNFDMSGVTKADRTSATTWQKSNPSRKKKKNADQ